MPNKAKAKNVQQQTDGHWRKTARHSSLQMDDVVSSVVAVGFNRSCLALIILWGIYKMSLSFLAIAGWFLWAVWQDPL